MAYAGFFLHLYNLVPRAPFDGGRITAVLAAPQVCKARQGRSDSEEACACHAVSNQVRLEYGFHSLGLTAFLAMRTHAVHDLLASLGSGRV